MLTTKSILTTLALTLLCPALSLQAANVSLTAADPVNTTSFNAAGKWNNSAAPSAANDYYTGAFFMRTPGDSGNTTYTFAGNSLTLQQPTSSGVRSLIVKSGGGDTFTINNLTNAFGGILENGGSGSVIETFTGNQWTIAANSAVMANQGSLIIGYPIVGASGVLFTNGGGNGNGITYNGNLTGFQGKFILSTVSFGNGGGNTKVILNAANATLGNPSTFTPDQWFVQGGCTIQDNIGLTFNNANGGITILGPGTGTINASGGTMTIAEPITDVTNSVTSVASLTKAGAGVLLLTGNNTYSGGTTISAGTLQVGSAGAITNNSAMSVTGILDLNGFNTSVNTLNGAGTVDNTASSAAVLTIGTANGTGSFTGIIQSSGSGGLSVFKVGTGAATVGGYTYSGNTVIAAGTLNLNSASSIPPTPGSLIVSNGSVLNANVTTGVSLPANNLVFGTNSTLNLTAVSTATGMTAAGNLTWQDNATNNITYSGALSANPSFPAINVTGSISIPGSNVVLNLAATGLQPGTFTLVKYGTGTIASLANVQLSPPPGVAAVLVNNTGGKSIDVQVTSVPNILAWNGVNGTAWNLGTANWTNVNAGGITIFQQYTNGAVIAGDSVTFDDTLTNDFVNPQPTNVVVTNRFFAFPLLVNSTLPYSISGNGGIMGVTSLVKSNTGSLTLLTSNFYTGGVNLAGGTLIITNDSALGASSGAITLNGGTLQINGGLTNGRAMPFPLTSTIGVSNGVTARLTGVINGAAATFNKSDLGTLVLAATENFSGNTFVHAGTLVLDSAIVTNTVYDDVGQNTTDNGTVTLKGTAIFYTTSDFNVGDLDSSSGTLNIQDTAQLLPNAFFIGSANAAGSTASGVVNMNGGSIITRSATVGTFDIGGRLTGATGSAILNLTNGYCSAPAGIRVGDFGTGVVNQYGGTMECTNAGTGVNLHRQSTGISGIYNLNGGTLRTEKVTSSQATPLSLFYFNGGTLQAGSANLGVTSFFNNLTHAYIRNGGAIIDDHGYPIGMAQILEHSTNSGDNAIDGGLTKLGVGTVTLNSSNQFTGPITNKAGTLIFNSSNTITGSLYVNAGTVQIDSRTTIQGTTTVTNNATLSITQIGSSQVVVSNVTLNGAATGVGGLLYLIPGSGYNSNIPLLSCGTLTLNGTNTLSLGAANLGVNAVIQYSAIAGSGNCTNLVLPQGATGYVSNSAANSTLYVVLTSTGPGLVWTGTNGVSPNLWDLNNTTNWLVNGIATSYHQIVTPGDAVIFNDIGSGSVTLNSAAAPFSMTVSNNSKNYTFSGTGTIGGSSGFTKLGTGTIFLNLTNDTYTGNTVVNGGVLQVGVGSALPSGSILTVGSGATFQANGFSVTTKELTGAGKVDNSSGVQGTLIVGSSVGGTWNGTITNTGGGGLSLHKNGSGTWIVGGNNYLNDGQSFGDTNQLNAGTTIITNNGSINASTLQFEIGSGQNGTVVIAGGTLKAPDNVLSVGYGAGGTGTLIVNSGTVDHSGFSAGSFAAVANSIDVGAQGSTGVLTVNGGQVLNNLILFLGDGTGSSGTLNLNGGTVQASVLEANGSPTTSQANFNGGTLLAATNTADLLLVTSMVMSNGLVLDDGGWNVTISSQPLQFGDAFGGGVIKKGAGSVYLDSASTYTGATLVTNGFLAGAGSVTGPMVVAPAGTLGAGDAAAQGSFNLYSNLTVQGHVSVRISKTASVPAQDVFNVTGNATYGGVLVVTNITSDATVLTNGDSFQIFNVTGTRAGNFASIVGSPGAGLKYTFTPATGILGVAPGGPAGPVPIAASIIGGNLSLTWPAGQGWRLVSQTNSLANGLNPATWGTVPVSVDGTYSTPVDSTKPTVFYKLVYP